ncbi:MAG: hypothetical protein GWO79_00815, partial [Actinobacteria bacterium]|nr:hypothetical protein [Actinomycetota bacterium]
MRPKFLLNSNISRETKEYLIKLGFIAYIVEDFLPGNARDYEVLNLAKKKRLIIITLDTDFGELYYNMGRAEVGIVILRLKNQTVKSVNKRLKEIIQLNLFGRKNINNSLAV